MPTAIRAVVAFNIVASIVVIVAAYSFGGGFAANPFPPEHEIRLEPIDPIGSTPAPVASVRASRSAATLPPEFDRIEPLAPRWETDRDGRIRLID